MEVRGRTGYRGHRGGTRRKEEDGRGEWDKDVWSWAVYSNRYVNEESLAE